MKVKVCGMKNNIAEVAGLKPDYMGFIFWEGSPRYLEAPAEIPGISPRKVGVFVDASLETLLEKIHEHQLDLVQLHGRETPEYCALLKEATTAGRALEIIKVFPVRDHFDFEQLSRYEEVCDYFLFDAKGPLPGGNGYAFDWQVLAGYPSDKPFFLSGGIGPDDIGALKEFIGRPEARLCHAVDVNSRFETEPGRKDTALLGRFMKSLAGDETLK